MHNAVTPVPLVKTFIACKGEPYALSILTPLLSYWMLTLLATAVCVVNGSEA